MTTNLLGRSRTAAVAGLAGLLVAGLAAAPAVAESPPLAGLQPGQQVTIAQDIPVNVVFLGGPPVEPAEVAAGLPATYEPVTVLPELNGAEYRRPRLTYQLDYEFVDAGQRLTDRFFRFLGRVGAPAARTEAQQAYTDQQGNRLEVPEQVLHIDARRVEQWLNTRGRAMLGLAGNSYTIFFIDWFGREDFEFHVYTVDDLDPDSGQPFRTRNVNAWGGAERSWFYDRSAGPVKVGGGWNVDDEDISGDGVADYRMPPSWEYHPDGFRDPGELAGDLGLIVRYVGVDLLFTPSPLYDAMASAPGPGGAKVISMHVFQELPGGDAIDRVDPAAIEATFAALQPYHDWRVRLAGSDPIDPDARHALELMLEFSREQVPPDDPGCWEPFGTPLAQLFCFFDANRDRYFGPVAPADYLAPAAIFEVREELLAIPGARGFAGLADPDWSDPAVGPGFVYALAAPSGFEAGGMTGFTGLVTHELGHHFGLSHTYDGWDPVDGLVSPRGDRLFVGLAAQVQSALSTARAQVADLRGPLAFSQFERDNLARWETEGHLNRANELAGQVLDHPAAHRVRHLIVAADRQAVRALRHFDGWRYDHAAAAAIGAYERVALAAQRLGIDPSPTADGQRVPGATPVGPPLADHPGFPDR